MSDDDHDIWLDEAREFLVAVRADPGRLEASLRQMCRRAFRDFRFPPSLVADYLAISRPGLFEEASFSDDEIDSLMSLVDRVIEEEWAALRAV